MAKDSELKLKVSGTKVMSNILEKLTKSRSILTISFSLPWIVGITVKLYLQAMGKPTLDWFYFFGFPTFGYVLIAVLFFSIPYLVIILFRNLLLSKRELLFGELSIEKRRIAVFICLLITTVGSIKSLLGIFWQFHAIFLYFPFLIPLSYLNSFLIGIISSVIFLLVNRFAMSQK